MNRILSYIFALLIMIGSASNVTAQDKVEITEEDYANQQVEMADKFRADGKIYVVVMVILVMLFGMFFYLYRMDKKVEKLEKQDSDN